MGRYINPARESKEGWLMLHANHVETPVWPPKEGYGFLRLVDNGPFTALAYAYNEKEFVDFMLEEQDGRPKSWWIARIEYIEQVLSKI